MSRRDLELIEDRHLPECLDVAGRLPACDVVADLGSGGGFPGIVISIARPDLQVHLIESITKKSNFLFDVGEELGLDIVVHNSRAEDLHAPLGGKFPVVTARAVARLDQLLPWSLPLLTPGGELWAIKGDQWPREVREARQVLRRLHAEVVETPDASEVASSSMARVVRISKN